MPKQKQGNQNLLKSVQNGGLHCYHLIPNQRKTTGSEINRFKSTSLTPLILSNPKALFQLTDINFDSPNAEMPPLSLLT